MSRRPRAPSPPSPSSSPARRWLPLVVTVAGLTVVIALVIRGGAPPGGASPAVVGDASLRWVVGDMHLHTEAFAQNGNPEYSLTPQQVKDEMRATGLQVGALLVWGVRPERTTAHFTGEDIPGDGPILHTDLEVSSFGSYVDHVIALGLKDLDFPRKLYTLPINRWALDQGAVVGAAHANHWAPDLNYYPSRVVQDPSEVPLCLALGQPLFLSTEIVDSPGFRTLYYGLLDCGFTVPLAGGSDWPVAGTHAGECRTYVWLEGPLTYRSWIEGIRQGRTVVSAGDLVVPTLDGRSPGDTLDVPAGATLALHARTLLQQADTIEVVANGVVIGQGPLPAGPASLDLTVLVRDSGWVCLRTHKVHTAAIYVRVAGQPVRASPVEAQYFANWVDVLAQQIGEPSFVVPGNPEFDTPGKVAAERAEALATYAPAKAVFERIRDEARAREVEPGRRPALSLVRR